KPALSNSCSITASLPHPQVDQTCTSFFLLLNTKKIIKGCWELFFFRTVVSNIVEEVMSEFSFLGAGLRTTVLNYWKICKGRFTEGQEWRYLSHVCREDEGCE
ncbi:MAG: hypothetical protein ACRCZO_13975, partial [Cetobacterium sp.]